jgi:DNA ligase (NAD+)
MPKLNATYIELMDTLGFIMRKRNDFMRARAYANAKETIATYPGDITSPEQLKGMKGIGTTIYQKLVDFTATGTLRVLEESKEYMAKKRAMDVFANIYGVGEKKAEELIDSGIQTMEELEKRKAEVLNDKQIIGLKYYSDILQRIPRTEIQEYEAIFKDAFPKDVECSRFEVVGSYRRGMPDSGDIDVIITSSHLSVFRLFVDELIARKIIIEVLSRGNSKCLVIAKLPSSKYARRVDFLYTTPEEYPFSVLYFTGSKEFNTVMREHALSMNFTLNEHGLSVMENKKKGELVNHVFTDEKSIFDFLNMEYKKPTERINGSAVVLKKGAVEPATGEGTSKATSKATGETNPKVKVKGTRKIKINPNPYIPVKESIPTPAPKEPMPVVMEPTPTPAKEAKAKAKKCSIKKTNPHIELFKKDGIKVLETLTEDELAAIIEYANTAFHCHGVPVMTDNEYDIVREYMQGKYPNNPVLTDVGAEIEDEKTKIKLPYEMASMDKIKPDTNILTSWSAKYKGPYVLSCKLDGVSGMFSTEGAKPKLYTRGDGKIGQDISKMIPSIKLPKDKKDIVIRGEFIIPKEVFTSKYAETYANPRNLVAGIVNQKTRDARIEDLRFVAYEVIKPAGLKPSEQMTLLESMNVDVVKHMSVDALSNEYLSEVLQDWRKNYMYEIDGVIVADDNIHPRTTGNPDHAFAFKMVLSDQMAESQVVDVIWTASKDGYLKPRVQIMPVKLGGVTIQFATGFNGSYIEENKIGIGAIIQIIRSGDVIPKIQSVTTPATQAKMPSEDYIWNDTHVDVMLQDATGNAVVLEKNITGFFKGIGVDGLGSGNVEKMIAAGFDSVPKILRMKKEDFLKVDGFKDKTATKLFEGIRDKVAAASLATIMSESNKLGRGFSSKRAELIMEKYPTIFEEGERNAAKLAEIEGFQKKSAEGFVQHIPEFLKFLEECGLQDKLNFKQSTPVVRDESHPLFGKSIVMTGFRDKELEEKLKMVGAKLGSSVSKNTFVVLTKDVNENTGKVQDAKSKNVPIMTPEDFVAKYL